MASLVQAANGSSVSRKPTSISEGIKTHSLTNEEVLCNTDSKVPLSQGINNNRYWKLMPSVGCAAVLIIPYLSLSFRCIPPSLHQEIVALGEAWGRHSNTTSPPLWITVDFFTGRRVKSGGEAEEETRVDAVCLALSRCNSCASAKMSRASPAITEIICHHQSWLIVGNNYGNECARPRLSEVLV